MAKKFKIIPDKVFSKLWKEAYDAKIKENYLQKWTAADQMFEFEKKYHITYKDYYSMLKNIYDAAHLDVRTIVAKSGYKKQTVADIFCIPIRTIESWYVNPEKCNAYIKLMMVRYFSLLNLGNLIILQSEYDKRRKPKTIMVKPIVTIKKKEPAKDWYDDNMKKYQYLKEKSLKAHDQALYKNIEKSEMTVEALLAKTAYLKNRFSK